MVPMPSSDEEAKAATQDCAACRPAMAVYTAYDESGGEYAVTQLPNGNWVEVAGPTEVGDAVVAGMNRALGLPEDLTAEETIRLVKRRIA